MGKPELREPAVAGQFYPASPAELSREIAGYLDMAARKTDAIGCVLPHAGYMYSGKVAGATVSRLIIKEKIFLIGPNHTGDGTPFSVMASGAWKTPLGTVPIDEELATALVESSGIFSADARAHQREHSLEVELPFLQTAGKGFSIVPLPIASDDAAALKEAGTRIASVVRDRGLLGRTLIAASSDMTHYEPRQSAEKKDRMAIEAIRELDADTLLAVVRRNNITMCGYAPVAVLITAAKALGAKKAELVAYATSGDVTGDHSSVVGYAGIILS